MTEHKSGDRKGVLLTQIPEPELQNMLRHTRFQQEVRCRCARTVLSEYTGSRQTELYLCKEHNKSRGPIG